MKKAQIFEENLQKFSFKVEVATHQIDRSVFDSHEDFGDKLGLGGVKTTEVATYQTCN